MDIIIGLATGSTAIVLAILCSVIFCFFVIYVCSRKKHQLGNVYHNYYTNHNMELQTFQDNNSLSSPTPHTMPLLYDNYSYDSAPYSVIECHTHKKRRRARFPLPKPPTVYHNQPCTFKKNQDDGSLSESYVLINNTEDIYEHMDSVKITDACQLESDDNVI